MLWKLPHPDPVRPVGDPEVSGSTRSPSKVTCYYIHDSSFLLGTEKIHPKGSLDSGGAGKPVIRCQPLEDQENVR